MASATDTEVVAMAAQRMAEIEELSAVLAKEGLTYETETASGSMMVRAHPAVGQRNEAMRHLQSLLSELGLTPAARSRVTAAKSTKQDNPFADLVKPSNAPN